MASIGTTIARRHNYSSGEALLECRLGWMSPNGKTVAVSLKARVVNSGSIKGEQVSLDDNSPTLQWIRPSHFIGVVFLNLPELPYVVWQFLRQANTIKDGNWEERVLIQSMSTNGYKVVVDFVLNMTTGWRAVVSLEMDGTVSYQAS